MIVAQIILWVCISINVAILILNFRNLAKLNAARRATMTVGEAYSKALEALLESENIREN